MDSFYFFSALIGSFILSIFSCFLFKWQNPFQLNNWAQLFQIIETKGLLSLPLFWLSFLLPFFLFITFGSIAWSGYHLSMTKEGFDLFLDISKLPLWLLAIAAPTSVVIARAHSTVQTAGQIKLLTANQVREINDNHMEHFFKYFERVGKRQINEYHEVNFEKISPEIYDLFFDHDSKPTANKIILKNNINDILVKYKFFVSTNLNFYLYHEICKSINKVINHFALHDILFPILSNSYKINKTLLSKEQKGIDFIDKTIGKNINDLASAIQCIILFQIFICKISKTPDDAIERVNLFDAIEKRPHDGFFSCLLNADNVKDIIEHIPLKTPNHQTTPPP